MIRYIGKGTTDENGIAIMTEDAEGNPVDGYTGTGAGIVNIFAECRSIQSEIYALYDVLFKDIGTEDDYTAWTSLINMDIARTTETILTPTDPTLSGAAYLTISSYTVPFNIEFDFCMDFTSNAGSSVLSIRQGSTSKATVSPNALGLTSGKYSHVILTVTDTELQINVDGTDKTPVTHDGVFNRFYITQNANALWQSIKYKNFVIYPV